MSECYDQGIATLRCIPVFINNVVNAGMVLAAITAVFFLSLGGIKYMLSGGDPVRVENAKKTMTYSIIGLLIILFAFAAINILARITSTPCIVKVLGCN